VYGGEKGGGIGGGRDQWASVSETNSQGKERTGGGGEEDYRELCSVVWEKGVK